MRKGCNVIVRSLEMRWKRLLSFLSFLSWSLYFDRAVWCDRRYNVYVLVSVLPCVSFVHFVYCLLFVFLQVNEGIGTNRQVVREKYLLLSFFTKVREVKPTCTIYQW